MRTIPFEFTHIYQLLTGTLLRFWVSKVLLVCVVSATLDVQIVSSWFNLSRATYLLSKTGTRIVWRILIYTVSVLKRSSLYSQCPLLLSLIYELNNQKWWQTDSRHLWLLKLLKIQLLFPANRWKLTDLFFLCLRLWKFYYSF